MSARHAGFLIGLFAVGFVATAAAIRPHVPWPREYGLGAKLAWFERHKDEFDVVYIGSSRVFRAFDPRVFEAELATLGLHVRAFNLGTGGMRPFEMHHVLQAVVALRPARVRWILYEGGRLDPRFDLQDDPESSRVVYWHTPHMTGIAFDSIACSHSGFLEKLDLRRKHAQVLLWNLTSLGQGRAILQEELGWNVLEARKDNLDDDVIAQAAGYVPFEENAQPTDAERHRMMLENPERIPMIVELVRTGNRDEVHVETLNLGAIAEQQELARSISAELVYVVPPDRMPTPDRAALEKSGRIEHLFDFNKPDSYPELFTIEARYDPGHLSRSGAESFSTLLAQRFAQHVRASGGSVPR